MSTKINFDTVSCSATISSDSPLTEVSFALEIAISNFLGRGVHRFDCSRTREENGDCTLTLRALCHSGPIQLSKVASLENAAQSGLFPRQLIKEDFKLEKETDQLIAGGQFKHQSVSFKKKANENQNLSIIETIDLDTKIDLAVIGYGLSDMITGLFALGIKYVKWQGSIKKTQLFVKHSLTENRLQQYLRDRQDYNVNQKVGMLSD